MTFEVVCELAWWAEMPFATHFAIGAGLGYHSAPLKDARRYDHFDDTVLTC